MAYLYQQNGMGDWLQDLLVEGGVLTEMSREITMQGSRAVQSLMKDPAFTQAVGQLAVPVKQAARDGATDAAVEFLPYMILIGCGLISLNILSVGAVVGGRR